MAKKSALAVASPQPAILVHEPVSMPFSELNFAPYNPRTISVDEMASLKASIRKHGLVLTLVVQKNSEAYGPNIIVGGHQRVRAVRELAAEMGVAVPETAWVVLLDVDDSAAKQLNISLNRVSGEFDAHMLGLVLADIAGNADFDLLSTGFDQVQIDELVRQATITPDEEAALLEEQAGDGLGEFARSITLTVEFETVEQRDEGKSLLKAMSIDQKPGTVLLAMLKESTCADAAEAD